MKRTEIKKKKVNKKTSKKDSKKITKQFKKNEIERITLAYIETKAWKYYQ